MTIKLTKPSVELLPSYLEAIQEGAFCNMALGIADDSLLGGKLFSKHDGFCGTEPNLIYKILL